VNLDTMIINVLSASPVNMTCTDLANWIDGYTVSQIRRALRNLNERGDVLRVVRGNDAHRYSIPRHGASAFPAGQPTVDPRTALLHDLHARGVLNVRHYVAELSDGELSACPTSKLVSIVRDLVTALEAAP
jgi:hypothetical protein